jgi:dihydrodipicolinate synthase/N-acetylneuraminate lyase
MARFDHLKGAFGLLPTPYNEDFTIRTDDLRAAAEFCCQSGQHGIVWPVLVGEFYFLGEEERIKHLDVVLEQVNGRLPVVFGCSGISVPQVLLYAKAAQRAGADAVIAMAPARTNAQITMDMFKRIADVYQGPIILQNADAYAPLSTEQMARLIEDVPQIEYVKEERNPAPKHISEVHKLLGSKVKTIFGGAAGKFLPDELLRGANGTMPACELADLHVLIMERWWAGDQEGARELHRRLLPLLILETYPFMRYILKQRGVFTTLVERAPNPTEVLDEEDKQEIYRLIEAIKDDIKTYPFLPMA